MRCAVGLTPEGLEGLDVSWGKEERFFVGIAISCMLSLYLNKTNLIDSKKKKKKEQKKNKTVTVVRALHATI